MKKDITFSEKLAFVRRSTSEEVSKYADNQPHEFHTAVTAEGELIVMVCGGPVYAFDGAREYGYEPVWMH